MMIRGFRKHFLNYGGLYVSGVLLSIGCASPQPTYSPPQHHNRDLRQPLPRIDPGEPDRVSVVRMYDPGSPAEPEISRRVTIAPTAPLPANASAGVDIDAAAVDTVLVFAPEIAPPESGLTLPDYNAYTASVERGFMDAGCKVVDRRRLEKLREEWKLRQADANAVDPNDTIALGKLLNARIVVFAEHLSASREQLAVSYVAPRSGDTEWKPSVRWIDKSQAADPDYWEFDWDRSKRENEREWTEISQYHHSYSGREKQFSPRYGSLWTTDAAYFQHLNIGNTSAGDSYTNLLGYAIPGYDEGEICQAWTWRFTPPEIGIFPVHDPPNDRGFDVLVYPLRAYASNVNQDEELRKVYEAYHRKLMPERREYAICDGTRAVITSDRDLRWFQSRVADPAREAAGFAAIPVIAEDGAIQYENALGHASENTASEAYLPICTVNLTAKIVVVETSQVAWIGTARITYTDVLRKPVHLPVRRDGPDLSAWPSLERQKAEILAQIFSYTANEFLARIDQ